MKDDNRQVRAVAAYFGMSDLDRHDFSDWLHELKDDGVRGSRNAKGDFTWLELLDLGREFVMLRGGLTS